MINAIIVDDEPLALDVLETYIESMPDITLVQKCSNAMEANEALSTNDIDLMFLDIQMPQLTGIDFLKTLSKPPMVIFTTAFANYAIEGFELNAIDYLLKPISLDRFMKAVNKAKEQLELTRNDGGGDSAEEGSDFIFVKADKKLIKLRYKDILYIEGLKDYVIIKRTDGTRIVTLQTMKSLEAKLPEQIFQRIHRSYIVQIDQIMALMGNMVEVIEKGTAKHLPVGKNYRDELLKIVNKNRL
ncbi:MAG: DNA-binding LytR/AlgR family response regulator [Polaribacter sp.]|jgi:DNA-binding LytR/AlgR family response regulator